MAQRQEEDDPDVQRNGFEAILEGMGVDPAAMKDWFDGDVDHSFDPTATWQANLQRFRAHLSQAQQVLSGVSSEDLEALDLDDATD